MGKKEGKRGSGKGITIYVVILLIIILGSGGYLGYRIYNANKDRTEETSAEATEEVVDERTVQIFQGDDRPVAVMIDNHKDAWAQSGLNDAYMIYEIIVEGSETRLMALFKGKDTNIIGPVRSARHYFLDYALENDALYGHIGWSPQAEDDIDELGVNNINGLIYDSGKERTELEKFTKICTT